MSGIVAFFQSKFFGNKNPFSKRTTTTMTNKQKIKLSWPLGHVVILRVDQVILIALCLLHSLGHWKKEAHSCWEDTKGDNHQRSFCALKDSF